MIYKQIDREISVIQKANSDALVVKTVKSHEDLNWRVAACRGGQIFIKCNRKKNSMVNQLWMIKITQSYHIVKLCSSKKERNMTGLVDISLLWTIAYTGLLTLSLLDLRQHIVLYLEVYSSLKNPHTAFCSRLFQRELVKIRNIYCHSSQCNVIYSTQRDEKMS